MDKEKIFYMFFTIVLMVNLVVNLYIYFRTRSLFPEGNISWWLAAAFFWLIAFSYVIGRLTERAGKPILSEAFITVGSWWLGAMVYLTLLFLLVDLARGVSTVFNTTGSFSYNWSDSKGKVIILAIYSLTAVILAAGYYNARVPVVRQVSIQLDKPVQGGMQKVVLVSDIHLGMTISTEKLKKMIELVNNQNTDVVLLAGDVFDEDLGPVIKNNLGDLLRNLKAKHGVFAVLGNHEFYGNANAAERYLKDHSITVLRDSIVQLSNGTVIVGREDITHERMTGKPRKRLDQLLSGTDTTKPVFLMDHQPNKLQEPASAGVDLQVSGHTHHGQMWPFNYITKSVFEISKGYGKINGTHFYVSSGFGTWGPPIRTNSRSEIVVLNVKGS